MTQEQADFTAPPRSAARTLINDKVLVTFKGRCICTCDNMDDAEYVAAALEAYRAQVGD